MMYHENLLLDALRSEGIEAEQVSVVKNGVTCKGIRILSDGNVSPIIYYSESESAAAFLKRVHEIMKLDTPKIDIDEFTSREYVEKNLFLSIQKKSTDTDTLKKPYLNLEMSMRLAMNLGSDGEGTIRVTAGLVERIGIPEDELWRIASQNTAETSVVRRLSEMLGLDEDDDEGGLYVASAGHFGGASVLYLLDFFDEFCRSHGENDCYVLPSSTEEVLILFGSEVRNRMSVKDLAEIVKAINTEQVDPVLQLEPVVYHFRQAVHEVSIAARA